ncbi:pyruvate/2-oxoglutarate dehydrogenase complex, dihydrolipoamide dehydrogenase component [Herbaspirillum sp. CF444]|uniref:glutathione-disulfide reductase n=1 Tax=Herbaspirillum sp. CF444 TaxID=1144319 RepID=UPI000272409A|nr:glutathione-disulfide reductase [Herbaspirillum sp. CF444]EJL81172.1 pyruvate/2-oxoglutarate dehydrogenase complex, dihydrolipoamide dehydrogenase component [Herbaspirillum sp. CF444]
MSQYDYDLFTIGGGSGGVRASRFASQYGARVAIAESKDLGGTCVNVGCIPKKLMSYSAHFHEDFADAAGFGWTVGESRFDWQALIAGKDKEIARLNGIYRKILDGAKVDIVEGYATVEDAHTVSVNGKRYTAAHILVATGGHPTVPDIPGKELGIVSDDFFHLTGLPKRSVVLGGGYIAVELASILNGLGSDVTLVYRGKHLLRGMDSELGVFLAEEMRKKGMKILFENNIEALKAAGDARQVTLTDGTGMEADCVLFATGRHANTAGMGLEKAGVVLTDKGAVKVDDNFISSVPSIHAIGDVIDRVALTPVALAEGMVVAARLFNKGGKEMSYANIPTAVFSHPNVGTVGLSEEDARKQVGEVRIFKSEFKALKHTLSGNGERTFMKLVVDAQSDRVLGVHMVGADAGEIVQGFAVALQCGATKAQFDATIGIHPTSAEEFVTMRTPVA